jgi:hypothetical protein
VIAYGCHGGYYAVAPNQNAARDRALFRALDDGGLDPMNSKRATKQGRDSGNDRGDNQPMFFNVGVSMLAAVAVIVLNDLAVSGARASRPLEWGATSRMLGSSHQRFGAPRLLKRLRGVELSPVTTGISREATMHKIKLHGIDDEPGFLDSISRGGLPTGARILPNPQGDGVNFDPATLALIIAASKELLVAAIDAITTIWAARIAAGAAKKADQEKPEQPRPVLVVEIETLSDSHRVVVDDRLKQSLHDVLPANVTSVLDIRFRRLATVRAT